MVGAVGLTGRGTSLICILFCLRTPFGVFIKYEWVTSALDRTSPDIDHFLVWGSCSLTGCVGRSCGSSLACASYLLCFCLVCGETLTVSLLARSLIAGRVVLSCLLCSDTIELSPSEKETDIFLLMSCWCLGVVSRPRTPYICCWSSCTLCGGWVHYIGSCLA